MQQTDQLVVVPAPVNATPAASWSWRAELAQFLAFLRHPRRRAVRKQTRFGEQLRCLLFLLALVAVLTALIMLPLDPLADWAGVEDNTDLKPNLRGFVMAILLAPISEELIFRAGLRSFTYTLVAGPVLICCFTGPYSVVIAMMIWALMIWLIFLRQSSHRELHILKRTRRQQARQFLRCYPAVFWLYVMAFGMIHTQNHIASSWTGLLLLPLTNLPQMLGGMALGYLRLHYGLSMSIAFHMCWNAGCMIALWLVP